MLAAEAAEAVPSRLARWAAAVALLFTNQSLLHQVKRSSLVAVQVAAAASVLDQVAEAAVEVVLNCVAPQPDLL